MVTAGSAVAVRLGLSWTAPGGQLLLLGAAGQVKVDWTPIWSRHLTLHRSYGYGESADDTFRAVLSLFSVMASTNKWSGRWEPGPS